MTLFGRAIVVSIVLLLVSGCSSGSRTSIPAIGGNAQSPSSNAAPYDIRDRAPLKQTTLTNARGGALDPALARLAASAETRSTKSTAGANDIEQVGVFVNPGGYYSAMYSRQSAYPAPQFPIAYPSGSTDTSAIYESMVAPNGGCFGNFATWINAGSGVQAVFMVYNYCGSTPGIAFETPIDSNFLAKYTQTYSDGIPMYATEIFTYDLTPTATSVWHSIIYNVQTRQYEELAETTGVNPSTTGFALWTTELQPQPCPAIPTMGAEYVEMWDNQVNQYNYVTPTLTGTTSSISAPATNYGCFNSDATGPASYSFNLVTANYHFLITQFSGHGEITEYPVPFGAYPTAITTGPDGKLWFTAPGPPAINSIGNVTTAGVFGGPYPITSSNKSDPSSIVAGPDGNLWFTEQNANKIGKMTTAGVLAEYPIPTGGMGPNGIVDGPDGNLWFIESNRVGNITTAGTFTEYAIPAIGQPFGITAGPDSNLWFTEFVSGAPFVGKVTTTGVFTEYATPGPIYPGAITLGPDGNLWFTVNVPSEIVKVTPSGSFTEYPIPTAGSNPNGITAGPDGNIWFTEGNGNKIGKVTTTGVFTEYPIPTANSIPTGITAGPDGNIWFTEADGNKIAKITP